MGEKIWLPLFTIISHTLLSTCSTVGRAQAEPDKKCLSFQKHIFHRQRAFFLTWLTTRRQRIISEPSPMVLHGVSLWLTHLWGLCVLKDAKLGSSDMPCYLTQLSISVIPWSQVLAGSHFLGLLWSLLSPLPNIYLLEPGMERTLLFGMPFQPINKSC